MFREPDCVVEPAACGMPAEALHLGQSAGNLTEGRTDILYLNPTHEFFHALGPLSILQTLQQLNLPCVIQVMRRDAAHQALE